MWWKIVLVAVLVVAMPVAELAQGLTLNFCQWYWEGCWCIWSTHYMLGACGNFGYYSAWCALLNDHNCLYT